MDFLQDLGGLSAAPMTAPGASATGGLTPQQKVALALQMQRGFGGKPGAQLAGRFVVPPSPMQGFSGLSTMGLLGGLKPTMMG